MEMLVDPTPADRSIDSVARIAGTENGKTVASSTSSHKMRAEISPPSGMVTGPLHHTAMPGAPSVERTAPGEDTIWLAIFYTP